MATEAETYADEQGSTIEDAIVETLCARIAYIAGVVLLFLIFLITLMTIANIPNLSYRIPNADLLNDAGGAVMGLVNGMTYCVLLCWALRFLGLFIGLDTLGGTLLGRLFSSSTSSQPGSASEIQIYEQNVNSGPPVLTSA